MGSSGKFAVITGLVAAGLLVLTTMTLAEPVFMAFLGVLGLACLACLMEILRRRRFIMLAIGGLATSLAVAGALAFLSTWELAFTDKTSLFGTPLPTSDPDNYFFLAALSALAALAALFAGAVWPESRRRAQQAGTSRGAGPRPAARGSSAAGKRTPARLTSASQRRTLPGARGQGRQPPSAARQVPRKQGTGSNNAARRGITNQGPVKQGSAQQPQGRTAPYK